MWRSAFFFEMALKRESTEDGSFICPIDVAAVLMICGSLSLSNLVNFRPDSSSFSMPRDRAETCLMVGDFDSRDLRIKLSDFLDLILESVHRSCVWCWIDLLSLNAFSMAEIDLSPDLIS